MAQVSSLIKFVGTIDGLTIQQDGTVKRAGGKKGTPSAARTKENNTEFSNASRQGKVIRDALRVMDIGDRFLPSRMFAVVRAGLALDPTNDRGKRVLSNSQAREVLPGFELNGNVNLLSVAPIIIGTTGNITVSKIGGGNVTKNDIYSPEGTTHVQAIAMVAKLNIALDILQVTSVNIVTSDINASDIVLPALPITADAQPDVVLTIGCLGLRFSQRINNKDYRLENGSFDVARVVAVL